MGKIHLIGWLLDPSASYITGYISCKYHLVGSIISHSKNLPSPSLGFCREMSNIIFVGGLLILIRGMFAFQTVQRLSSVILSFCVWSVPLSCQAFSFFSRWKVNYFKKVKFFVWYVLHGRVHTLGRILARGSMVVSPFSCIMCKIFQ